MIVIYRNGVPTVVTGWRAWLIMLAAALAFVLIAGLVLKVALTVWTVLLFALPLMFLFAVQSQGEVPITCSFQENAPARTWQLDKSFAASDSWSG
jgi:hypothetical protein